MSNFPIIDFHCDLLAYLQKNTTRTPHDSKSRCSLPQLHQGKVKLQILAIYTETEKQSVFFAEEQLKCYRTMLKHYSTEILPFTPSWMEVEQTCSLIAFENASSFCNEEELLEKGIERLNKWIQTNGKPVYMSLTWNEENRFGGGVHAKVGLKEDGKRLLNVLSHKKIAVDLSHTSDALAYDIINYIEREGLEIPLLASHSNSRTVRNHPRNLTDELAKEIIRRKGIIGMNLYRPFVGEDREMILDHIVHWLDLKASQHLVFGADFFSIEDFPKINANNPYFQDFSDSSCYPHLLQFIKKELNLDQSILEQLAYKNAFAFIESLEPIPAKNFSLFSDSNPSTLLI